MGNECERGSLNPALTQSRCFFARPALQRQQLRASQPALGRIGANASGGGASGSQAKLPCAPTHSQTGAKVALGRIGAKASGGGSAGGASGGGGGGGGAGSCGGGGGGGSADGESFYKGTGNCLGCVLVGWFWAGNG